MILCMQWFHSEIFRNIFPHFFFDHCKDRTAPHLYLLLGKSPQLDLQTRKRRPRKRKRRKKMKRSAKRKKKRRRR
jgi:hypothetical protein